MSLALLFPGQGTQGPDMLRWLDGQAEASGPLSLLAAALGADWRARLTDASWASSNRVAQVLLTGTSLAAWSCLAGHLPAPAVVAGYSVGELPAFCAAGVFDAATALQLAQERALVMDRSVAGQDTGLLAVHGLLAPAIEQICTRHGLVIAIRMAADRVVLGGASRALAEAESELEDAGVRCTRLAVRIASHTPWVATAAGDFAQRLHALPFAPPRAALVCNLGGVALRGPEALKQALAGQIASTVRWDACMDTLAERRVACVLEVGPGSTLSRLWNERAPDAPARSVDEFHSPEAVLRWVRGKLGQ